MTGNRIELEGRLRGKPEVRLTPAGTPVVRFKIECGAAGEELKLGVVITGEAALEAQRLLEPAGQIRVIGRMRQLKGSLKTETAFEVVAETIERNEP